MFHHNKEMKKTGSNHLTKMKFKDANGNVQITTDPAKIEDETVKFFEALFNGRHDKNLVDTGQSFKPSDKYLEEILGTLNTLSERSKTKMVRGMTYNEVKQKSKTVLQPDLMDLMGYQSEFYKATWDTICELFTEVIKKQLRNFTLIESGKHGVTSLLSKVTGVLLS